MADITTWTGMKKILTKYDLTPKKGFGQNFLMDRNILNKMIASLALTGTEYVVEIGPGLGILTQKLTQSAGGVLAIDKDERLKDVLTETCAGRKNLCLKFADVLKTDIEAELCRAFSQSTPPPFLVCANIPYNITTPIIFQLLENCPHLTSATLMIQKEVADRLTAKKDSKAYGRLTLTAGYFARTERLLSVSRHCFHPAPQVDSTVVRLTPYVNKPYLAANENRFRQLLAAAFQQRRKTILKTFSAFFGCSRETMEHALQTLSISPQARPENLTLEHYVQIVNHFS